MKQRKLSKFLNCKIEEYRDTKFIEALTFKQLKKISIEERKKGW
jgi:hypothetical protein